MISDEEYKKTLKQFHKLSDRHILVAETDMSSCDIQKVVKLSDKIRKAGNELVGLMRKNYDQLMQKQYDVTWDFCRKSMIFIGKKYNVDAVFALTKAEDIWRGMEKCLYANGNILHFSKYGDLPCIRAKQINRAILLNRKLYPSNNCKLYYPI